MKTVHSGFFRIQILMQYFFFFWKKIMLSSVHVSLIYYYWIRYKDKIETIRYE